MPPKKKQSAETKRKLAKQIYKENIEKAKAEQKAIIELERVAQREIIERKKVKQREIPEEKKNKIKEQHNKRNIKARSNPINFDIEKERLIEKRQDPDYLELERLKKVYKRTKPDNYNLELEQKVERYQTLKSQDKELYEGIKKRCNVTTVKKRLDPEYVKQENEDAQNRMAIKRKNIDPGVIANKRIKIGSAPFEKFRQAIRKGPDVTCSCCKRLWFQTSCIKLDRQKLEEKFGLRFCENIFNIGANNTFCRSCAASIRNQVTPKYCSNNYEIVFKIPNELKNLTVLEERLVALRIPFMKIQSYGFNQQCSIKGQIVNVPINVDSITDVLPRNPSDTQTIQMKLMRKMDYTHAYKHETIRPAVVLKALDYLLKGSLYKEHKVQKDNDWEKNVANYVSQDTTNNIQPNYGVKQFSPINIDNPKTPDSIANMDINDMVDSTNPDEIMTTQELKNWDITDLDKYGFTIGDCRDFMKYLNPLQYQNNNDENNITNSLNKLSILPNKTEKKDVSSDDNDMWADINLVDNPEPINPGGEETLLDPDEVENICFAPGEKNRPIHLMLDKYAEELSFPTIFCGEKKIVPDNYNYSDHVKIQAQHEDRRFARTDFLLYMSKKAQLIKLVNAVRVALRMKVNQSGEYTAGEVRNPDNVNKLVQVDAGYMFLSKVKSSPAYWKQEQRKVMAMIRQFNIPSIFLTISAAESRWPELLVILMKLVDNKIISEEEALELSYVDRVRLIRADPITCARYFDHRFRLLFKHLKSDEGPFQTNPIEHYYYRIEFQHRGSPHVHALLWLTNAPKYDSHNPESSKICSAFADQFITCNKNLVSIQDILVYNVHVHSKSCRREIKGKYMCRYGIPYLPMDFTTILEPIETKDEALLQAMKDKYQKIMETLNNNNEMTFNAFLDKLQLTKDDYLSIIQHCIKKSTMYIKRSPNECLINHFNEEIFSFQRSNMDIQYILDAYACCKYIVSYINKSERGISGLLKEAVNEIKNGNLELKVQLKKIAGIFLNSSEISAQEAAYNVLQLGLFQTCTGYKYINTKPINQRVRMLKSLKSLNTLPSDNKNIYETGVIEHYAQRPDDLSDTCLAEFAAHWVFKSTVTTIGPSDKLLKDGSGLIHYKKHANIINYCHYGLQQDPINYYREQIMLYMPWRYELDEIENADQQLVYAAHSDTILSNRTKFDQLDTKLLDDALLRANEREVGIFDRIVEKIDDEFLPYAVDNPEFDAFNILDAPKDDTVTRVYPTPFQISDDKYDELIASLNFKQYEFLNHVLNNLINQETCYSIIGGAAGCGKSLLISTIFQSLLRYYNSIPGNDPDTIKVLLTAPTGKAAFSIQGTTLHSALSLPITKSYDELIPLSNDTANSIYTRLCHLKLIIIDEYSMVGAKMFDNINKRLQQLFKSKADFGGISIILFGDLRQLAPVGEKWIFEPMKNNPYYEICGSHLWDMFDYFELTEIMRQRDDKHFASALNRMANGTMTLADIKLIKSRQVKNEDTLPDNIIHLFRSNNEVDLFNEQRLATFTTERTISVAIDIVKGSCSERLKQFYLKSAQTLKKSECYGLGLNLTLQIGAKYMVSINIDTADGIVNGATGILMQIDYDDDHNAKRCWLEFFDSNSGKTSRLTHSGYMKSNGIPNTWTPIERCAKAVQIKKGSNVMVERAQFPMQISEGITIHKSQGATYEQVAVHLKKGITRNAVYVACSRATSLAGLYIFGDFNAPKLPTEKDKSSGELKNLQQNKYLNTTFNIQYVASQDKQTIIYQNVQSLVKHCQLIKNNPIFINADILLFVETWLHETDSIEFDNFECFIKISNNNQTHRKPFGISCYRNTKTNNNVCTNARTYLKTVGFVTFQAIIFTCNNICIIVVYIPPKLAIREALICLQELIIDNRPTVIVGDFNQDISVSTSNCLIQFLLSKQFASQTDTNHATTVANTHIDWCFSNVNRLKSHIYPTVYSHHHAIAFNIYETNITNCNFIDNKQRPSIVPNVINYQIKQDNGNDDDDDDDNMSVKSFNHYDDDDVPMDIDESLVAIDDNANNNNIIPPMTGLYNRDGVSCYANVAVQCLLSIVQIRPLLTNYSNPPTSNADNIKKALHNILSRQNSDCHELRQFVGGEYTLREQNDAHLFLLAIFAKLRNEPSLRYFQFSYIPNTVRCINCESEVLGHVIPNAVSHTLYFPENSLQSIEFSAMYEPRPTDQQCDICQSNCTTRPTLLEVSDYLIINLQRIQTAPDGTQYKISTIFNRFDENLVIIDDIMFCVKAVAIHLSNNSNNINQGHYIAHIKYNDEWWLFNDSQVKRTRFDKSLSNVTILLLEKIS